MAQRHHQTTDQSHNQQQPADDEKHRIVVAQNHDHDHRRQCTDHRQEALDRHAADLAIGDRGRSGDGLWRIWLDRPGDSGRPMNQLQCHDRPPPVKGAGWLPSMLGATSRRYAGLIASAIKAVARRL
jgi:hypothetical protein